MGIYSVVEFEVLEPATVNFPDHVNQLLILNRAPFTFDVFNEEDREGMEAEHLTIIDTLITNTTFRGMQEVLRESPIDRFHTPLWVSERRTDTALLDDLILTKREVETICSTYKVNALISLEYYSMDINERIVHYSDAPSMVQHHYYEVSNNLKWNIHLPESPTPFDSYSTADTIYFTDIQDGESIPIPSAIEMVAELFRNSGRNYGRYLVPVWNSASRTLYKGKGDSLKLASKFTDNGDWIKAFSIWKDLSQSTDSTSVSKACHNMAVYYELEDNLDSASLMVDRALKYNNLELISNYRDELETRILNQKEVRDQVR